MTDAEETPVAAVDLAEARLRTLEVTGYRALDGLQAALGDLTIFIGANATGKSSLFDFLRFLGFAASSPLPAGIDPWSEGKQLFHAGGPERIAFALEVSLGGKQLRYDAEIRGPLEAPAVARERLVGVDEDPFTYLEFRGGRGFVRDPVDRGAARPPWTVPPNDLALRRALDPTLHMLGAFQRYLGSWGYYGGFHTSMEAGMRKPVVLEPEPRLAADGSNLSAVLHSLMTEHRDAWDELETLLRACIRGFASLNVKSRGGRGRVMAVWREEGVKGELTLADLSDGTLQLLCWLALALSPSIPPLVCIDEPEVGLHPRVLPTLAGALRQASARAQLLIATHSPYFLSQFTLDEIAVMRKEDGRAVFVRPTTSEALRREVDEIGGEALARLFLSEELEVLP